MSKKLKRRSETVPATSGEINATEYLCNCCGISFFVVWHGEVDRCPKCGTTSEVNDIANVKLAIIGRWARD